MARVTYVRGAGDLPDRVELPKAGPAKDRMMARIKELDARSGRLELLEQVERQILDSLCSYEMLTQRGARRLLVSYFGARATNILLPAAWTRVVKLLID